MSLLAISDIHISGPDDPLYRSLLALLRERAAPGDIVVLAGDLFDLFVGNKPVFTQRYSDFIQAVREAGARGVKIHYIEGNHDFLIRRVFVGFQGLQVHSHDVSIEMGGKRFYFAHGDTANRSDYSYLALRAFFRSLVVQGLVAVVPGRWLDWFGKQSSQRSRKTKPILFLDLPHDRMEHLRKIYRNYAAEKLAQGYDFVVMGHCHDLDEMCFNIGGRAGQYINIGFPRAHGSFISWSPGDVKIQRERLPGR